MKRMAVIHSLSKKSVVDGNFIREVEIVQKVDNNHVIAEYDGKHYTAVDNPFSGYIYVDDLYGEVEKSFRF